MIFLMMAPLIAQNVHVELKGTVLDQNSSKPLESAIVNLKDTNVSTVTNSEGQFVLKIQQTLDSETLVVSLIGYKTKEVDIKSFKNNDFEIFLIENVTLLSEVNLSAFKNAENLVRKVFENKAVNNQNQAVLMTAFYRETIKKRNKDVSLTEAVVNLYKQSYSSNAKDQIKIHKARKSTNYKRIDTLALKLQGGPFSTLYLDMMKYPEYIFTDESISEYDFTFDAPSSVNNRPVYVLNFKQKDTIPTLGYQGKLFVDVESLALTSASYSLVLDGKKSAQDFLVQKKPRDVEVYPIEALYKVNYREKNGKWYYGYGSIQLTFKVDKTRKLFNSEYTIASEMAITDWEITNLENPFAPKDRLRPTVILHDAVSGFSDPNFWGEYNQIEPEKSIESAIDKIRRKIKREGTSAP